MTAFTPRLPIDPWLRPHPACRVKMVLEHSDPPIWRSLVVPLGLPLDQFHLVLQLAMGWQERHLYEFIANRQHWEDCDEDGNPTGALAKVTVLELFAQGNGSAIYTYDFGDNWRHVLHRVEIVSNEGDRLPVQLVAGDRACPPEDLGGIGTLEEVLAARGGAPSEDIAEVLAWLGDWDPAQFDLTAAQRRLAVAMGGQ